ncbi:MAG: response regulator transcription factor [Tannerellaceae bacterium]|jgi:DNA-binding response OmpR family regulator|nr:response regulator transcription factor [Tannerellaceae bacterium]
MDDRVKIFFCEDDENLGQLLREFLLAKGYAVDLFPDGDIGAKAFPKEAYELCILDVMMPKKDGFALAQEIRSTNPHVPIIFLTAKSMKEDVLEGFRIGGDDYLSKPFSMEELMFRIEAILRRVKGGKRVKTSPTYQLGKFIFDSQKQTLSIGKESNKLTTKESELLSLLCSHANEVLERNYALRIIWVEDNYFNARSMDVYITKLRKILKKDPTIEIINIHGKGYKLITPQGEAGEEVQVV